MNDIFITKEQMRVATHIEDYDMKRILLCVLDINPEVFFKAVADAHPQLNLYHGMLPVYCPPIGSAVPIETVVGDIYPSNEYIKVHDSYQPENIIFVCKTDKIFHQVTQYMKDGNKVNAIKCLREKYPFSLKGAKDFVERYFV